MRLSIILLTVVLLFSACTSSQYGFEYDKGYDFSNIETFAFHENVSKLEFINKENLALVKENIKKEMAEKGITLAEDDPDVIVNIFAIAHDQIEESKYPQNNGYVIQAGSSYIANPDKTRETIMGSLFLDIYDTKTNEPVWQASREKIISSDPESNRRILENSIKSMMTAFPPGD